MRKEECDLLLKSANELIDRISSIIDENKRNSEKREIMVPEIKSFFEQCRSVLDYIAFDIFDSPNFPRGKVGFKKIYFPFGDDPIKFYNRTKEIFPNLKEFRPDLYDLIESIQDYKLGTHKFLCSMAQLVTENKHRNLTKHKRKDDIRLGIYGFVQTDDSSNIIIENSKINGVQIDHIEFRKGEILGEINDSLRPLIFKNNIGSFVIPSIDKEVISFINLCYEQVKNFKDSFYNVF